LYNTKKPKHPVLIVDDEQSWIVSMKILLLRKLGINNTIACTDSRMVSSYLASNPISLVLLDYTMPYMNAEQVLAETKSTHSRVPVIVLTGQDYLDLAENCMELGAFDHFIKTSGTDSILSGVKRALNL
jgi:DNA-binding NtrC family response regulator